MAELRFFVKRPGKGRKSFGIVAYALISRTEKQYEPLSSTMTEQLKIINAQFSAGMLSPAEAELLVGDLILAQYRKSNVAATAVKAARLGEINSKVFAKFWADVYAVKYLEDEGSARYDFERSLRAIEPLAINSASKAELQSQLRKVLKTASRIRRASDRLNELLKYLGITFKLEKPKKPRKQIKHLNSVEILKMARHIECTACSNLAVALFASGARLGEAMALESSDFVNAELRITKQRVAYGTKQVKNPKREKIGTVSVLKLGTKDLMAWIAVEDKWAHRWHINKELAAACEKAGVQVISPHDLRHSHAIHLLALGATLTDVSMNLRNRIEVCQEYYTGYSHSEGTLERLKKITS